MVTPPSTNSYRWCLASWHRAGFSAGRHAPEEVDPALWSGLYQLTSLNCRRAAIPLHRKTQRFPPKTCSELLQGSTCVGTQQYPPLATGTLTSSRPNALNTGQQPGWTWTNNVRATSASSLWPSNQDEESPREAWRAPRRCAPVCHPFPPILISPKRPLLCPQSCYSSWSQSIRTPVSSISNEPSRIAVKKYPNGPQTPGAV